jgi:hypothetical protein
MALARAHTDEAIDGLVSVPLLRWPAESEKAARLEASGAPFLLLLGSYEPPPQSAYRFMDWVRSPCDPDELIMRRSNLQTRFIRSREGLRPHLDCETGRLTFGRSTVDISPSQVVSLRPFVNRYREVVPAPEVCKAFGAAEEGQATIASRIMRLRRRLLVVGLQLLVVRGVGYTLEPTPQA